MPKPQQSKPAPPVEPHPDLSGRRLGDFQVLRKLGQGGMGQVYLAEQISLKRKVALKVLRPDVSSRPEALKRFKVEAEAVARVTHANIVQVYQIGQDQGIAFMALEYVEGKNLREYLNKKGPPELLIALSIMRQTASALQRASEAGITHRDIKPENILLTRKGEVKVADFGLSRCLEEGGKAADLTQTGVTMGTPLYMSPEQVQGKPIDPRSDIYSFGVTCYHMFAGHPPFRGETAFEIAVQHVQKEPTALRLIRPDLPEAVCAIIHKMMAKSPEKRYQTARDVSRDVMRLREGLSGTIQTMSPSIAVDAPSAITLTPMDDDLGGPTQTIAPPDAGPADRPAGEGLLTRRWMLVGAGVLAVLVAVSGGMAYAWRARAREGPLPPGQDIRPGDAAAADKVDRPSKREQELKAAAEPYLNKPKGTTNELAAGLRPCMDLGVFYLDNDRLKDADSLFRRLETFEHRSYHALGELGRAVVLALQNEAAESNEVFHDIFPPPPAPLVPKDKGGKIGGLVPRDKGGKGGGRPSLGGVFSKDRWSKLAPRPARPPADQQKQLAAVKPILSDPRWQYYLIKAREQNRKNGIDDRDVPSGLLQRINDFRSGKRF